MYQIEISLQIEVFENRSELAAEDLALVQEAERATEKAYAPYSGFRVGSAALLDNGAVVSAANQENASYPVCICAEIAMLGACSSLHPGAGLRKVAVVAGGKQAASAPVAPCGQCRQALLEFEARGGAAVKILLAGQDGQVYSLPSAAALLPLFFSKNNFAA